MPKIDPTSAPLGSGSRYPAPFDEPCKGRSWRRLGDAAGLTQVGVHLLRLPPGVWSSQRHWHALEDEFACFQNRSSVDAVLLVVGSRNDADHGEYTDIDVIFTPGRYSGRSTYRRRDGTPY